MNTTITVVIELLSGATVNVADRDADTIANQFADPNGILEVTATETAPGGQQYGPATTAIRHLIPVRSVAKLTVRTTTIGPRPTR